MHNISKTYLLLIALGMSHPIPAEVVLDGTLGPSGPLAGSNFAIEAELGQQMGNNLFHSFERFNLNTGEMATFSGPNSIQNIISRVTGGNRSEIDGTIRSEIPNADMYFLNQAGIFFGPNATLDVKGSFYTSTADYLRLGNDGRFDVRQPQNSLLTVAPPSAFGFLDGPPASIEKQGFLSVPEGKTIALIGGDLILQDEALTKREQPVMSAPSGQVYLISVASKGEVPMTPENLSDDHFEHFGNIKITDTPITLDTFDKEANVEVSGDGGGKVYIQGGQIVMENVLIFSDNSKGTKNGQGITVKATDTFSIKGTSRINSDIFPESTGNGSDIDIEAKEIKLTDGAQITAQNQSSGISGHITLKAIEKITFSGFYQEPDFNVILFNSALSAQTSGTGNGGKITVIAPAVILENTSFMRADSIGQGDAGDISLQVDTLTLKEGAQLNVNSGDQYYLTAGHGGTLTITAKKAIRITGQFIEPFNEESKIKSGLFGNTFTASEGGTIIVSAPLLEIQDNGAIQTATKIKGNGGQISLNVETLNIDQNGSITTETQGEGPGGRIEIQTQEINLTGKGLITSESSGLGNAGSIQIMTNTLRMNNASITTDTQGADGGNITISSPSYLYLRNGSNITASTIEDGHGGNITLKPEFIILENSQIKADAVEGKGGHVKITSTSIYNTQQGAIKHYQPEQLAEAEQLITARSQSQLQGMDGIVEIDVSDVNVAENLAVLPTVFKADELLPTPCSERFAKGMSEFVKVYSEGMSNAHNDLLPSGLMSFEPIEVKTSIAKKTDGKKKRSPLLMGRLTECQPLWLSMSARVKTPK